MVKHAFWLLLFLFAHIEHVLAVEVPFRLPQTVIPLHYRLDLEIVPDAPRFGGVVEIDVRIDAATDEIWLHGRGLAVIEVALRTADGRSIPARYEELSDDGMALVALGERVTPQRATLVFRYSAEFGSGLYGIYRVAVDQDDYAFSQFESIWARTAFPCFDEPGFKSTFDIAITTRTDYKAFTNTRSVSVQDLGDAMQRVTYATTLSLPTYLIAFAIGPLDVVEWEPVPASANRRQPLPLRGIATRGQGARMEYALENTASLLLSLEEYFGTAYPFDKLDIVAVPDFGAGAMENAGLITYREPLILLGEDPGANQVRFYVLIHSHELAHQWFGNIVTMPWWDDIWLNEAFASWIQARNSHLWDPAFNFDRSTQSRAIRAMQEDSLIAARQIREPVEATADILNAFDSITYRKGAGVLQMLENYIGPENFRTALRRHMTKFRFGSADVYDLIASLTDVAGEEQRVPEIFESFLFQPGVPYLDVQPDCDADGDAGGDAVLRVSQRRFLPVGSRGDPDRRWSIPLCFAHGSADTRYEQCALVTDAEVTVRLEPNTCPSWVMPNAGGAGYYRWQLPEEDLGALQSVFATQITARERISFVDSLVAGIQSGDVPVDVFLEILPTLFAARERAVVEAPLDALRSIFWMIEGERESEAARSYISGLLKRRLAALEQPDGAESETEASVLRAKLLRFLAVDLRDPETRAGLRISLLGHLGYPDGEPADSDALPPDLLRAALTVAVQDGDAAFLDFLLARFSDGASSRFRLAVMQAIALVDDPVLVARAHRFILSSEVRGNELDRWLDYSLHPAGYEANWPWLRENLDDVFATGANRLVREAPYSMGQWLCSRKDARRLDKLFADRVDSVPGMERNLARALEQVELCVAFEALHGDAAAEYFTRLN